MLNANTQITGADTSFERVDALMLASELDYFRTGAHVDTLTHGKLFRVRGFADLASGVVLHNVSAAALHLNADDWLSAVESRFDGLGAAAYRLYITSGQPTQLRRRSDAPGAWGEPHDSRLIERGYQREREVGLCLSLADWSSDPPMFCPPAGLSLVRIRDGEQHAARKALYCAAQIGRDGYAMQSARFADYEKLKQNLGYMSSFLLLHDEEVVGCVSLSVCRNFGRLKNLLIHPRYRGRGYSRGAVELLKVEALRLGALYFGAYVAEGKPGYRSFLRCGMREVLSQLEYYKPIR